jgi:hypothetical protein
VFVVVAAAVAVEAAFSSSVGKRVVVEATAAASTGRALSLVFFFVAAFVVAFVSFFFLVQSHVRNLRLRFRHGNCLIEIVDNTKAQIFVVRAVVWTSTIKKNWCVIHTH